MKRCLIFSRWNAIVSLLGKLTTAAHACEPAALFQVPPDFLSCPALEGATKQEREGDVYQAQPAHAHTVFTLLVDMV